MDLMIACEVSAKTKLSCRHARQGSPKGLTMRHLVGRASTVITLFAVFVCVMIAPSLAVAGSPEVRTEKDVYAPKERIVVIAKDAPGNRLV